MKSALPKPFLLNSSFVIRHSELLKLCRNQARLSSLSDDFRAAAWRTCKPMSKQAQRILIVDDEAPLRFLLSKQLSRAGFDVTAAADGPAALSLAAEKPFDAVVLDVVMPGMDGFEVCRRLKADPRTAGTPVLFLSASAGGEFRRRAFRIGAIDFLVKPFQTELLPAYLRAVLGDAANQREDRAGQVAAIMALKETFGSADAAVELAEAEALRCGCPVMLIDLELPAGSIGARLQLSGGPNVRLLLQDTGEPVTAALIGRVAQRLHFALEVIPAPFTPSPLGHEAPDASRLNEVIDLLAEAGYYVMIHLGANGDDLAARVARRAEVVYTPGLEVEAALEDVAALVALGVAREAIRPLSKTVVALAEATESRRGLGRERGPARATVPAFGQLAAVL